MRTIIVAIAALAGTFSSATMSSAWWSATTVPGGAAAGATAVAPPSALTTTLACPLLAARRVDLLWTPTLTWFASGYDIARATTSGGPYSVVGSVSGRATVAFTDFPSDTSVGKTYHYVIRASRGRWRSGDSNVASVTMPVLC